MELVPIETFVRWCRRVVGFHGYLERDLDEVERSWLWKSVLTHRPPTKPDMMVYVDHRVAITLDLDSSYLVVFRQGKGEGGKQIEEVVLSLYSDGRVCKRGNYMILSEWIEALANPKRENSNDQ